MATDGPPTSRLCPACGLSEAPRRASCRVCRGTGLVTPDQVTAWLARQRARATTSSMRDVPGQVEEALAALRARPRATTNALIVVGERLLEHFREDPEGGARAISDWLSAVQSMLRGDR